MVKKMNKSTVLRLARYLRVLLKLKSLGFIKVFSNNLGDAIGVTPAVVRKDFSIITIPGNKRGGYNIDTLIDQLGAVLGDPINCSRMLENGEAIVVFPEGIRGSGKLYKDRYQLKRFGTGFVHLAMKHDTPIVPVGVVGCEETIPAFANIKPLAALLNVPYVPVALPFIFPAKVHLNFGKLTVLHYLSDHQGKCSSSKFLF